MNLKSEKDFLSHVNDLDVQENPYEICKRDEHGRVGSICMYHFRKGRYR